MDNLLTSIKEIIDKDLNENDKTTALTKLLDSNINTPVPLEDFVEFTRLFSSKKKANISGCININGTGASGMKKPNLSSIAALYLSQLSEIPVVKTGSVYNTGISGSSDFFADIGYFLSNNRERIFRKYGFMYYDFLELSPWKRYHHIFIKNKAISEIYSKVVFFDYNAGLFLLGVSNPSYYSSLLQNYFLENRPQHLVTFYTIVQGGIVDEIMPGDVYVDNRLFCKKIQSLNYQQINSREDARQINSKLLTGEETGYWKTALSMTCAYSLIEIGKACSMEEGEQMFEKAYKDRAIKGIINML